MALPAAAETIDAVGYGVAQCGAHRHIHCPDDVK
jgi:hypothetical protein